MWNFKKMTSVVLVSALFFAGCSNIYDPVDPDDDETTTVIYKEDFGTSAVQDGTQWPSITAYQGFNKTGAGSTSVTYSSEVGLVTLRTNSPSSGYTGASGSVNAMMATGGAALLVNDIAVCGARNLVLSFGSNQTSEVLKVAYRINGTTQWVELAYDKYTENWGLVDSVLITLPETANTIRLRFTAGTTQFGTRIDDIKITTTDTVSDPVVDPDEGGVDPDPTGNDPDPVTALAEDFESFTTGTGDAYFNTQANNKGWFGFGIQGTLQPDLRVFNNNKYVQFSAHRTAITTATAQEFWLLSPRLDLTNAPAKMISFDMSAGFFNDNTVFEVYVIDGNTPSAPKTKLEGWRIPVAADLSGTYTPFINSGSIDVSAFSGVKRIGFYYKGTSGSGNSTTYQLDNFVLGDVPSMVVAPSSLSFVREGEAKSFTVTSNRTWTATSSDPTNFAVSVVGNEVTVTATENATGASRTATVTVEATDNSISRTVSISQSGPPAAGGNLVQNGDFSAPWTSGVPAGWSVDFTDRITITQGSGSFIVTNPTGTTKFFQEIEVEAGATYELKFDYTATHLKFRIWSGFRVESGGQITYQTATNTTDPLRTNNGYFSVESSFKTMTYTFTVPANQTLFLLEYRYYTQAASSFELKNVSLVKQ